jgi:hypothetical protein
VEPPPDESAEPIDPHDRRLILASLKLTPEERLLRLEHAHALRVLIRDAQPYELLER